MTKKKILEHFVTVYKEDNYSPVAAKILGAFYISNQKHLTFYEIMKKVGATKGAISKSLNFLLEQGEVDYVFDEKNKRLRLFYLDTEGFVNKIFRFLKSRQLLNELLKEIINLRNNENEDLNQFIKSLISFHGEISVFVEGKMKTHLIDKDFIKKVENI